MDIPLPNDPTAVMKYVKQHLVEDERNRAIDAAVKRVKQANDIIDPNLYSTNSSLQGNYRR
jgi:hypothetical protein